MKLKVSEKGVRHFQIQDPGKGPTSEVRKVDLVHDLVLSIENRYTNIPDVDGTRTIHTYDGKTGKRFRYATTGRQTEVDLISRLPYISLSIEPLIILTGVTNFDGCSNAKLVADVKEMEWGDRLVHRKLGDCVVLKRKEIRQNGCTDKRTMYFGVWDSKIVLLRDELESAEPMEGSRILTYRWSSDFEYGQKFGKLLPETWTKLIASEWTDLEGNAVHKPLIIRSTTNAITSCEFLDRFPEDIKKIATDPTATVIDRREQR